MLFRRQNETPTTVNTQQQAQAQARPAPQQRPGTRPTQEFQESTSVRPAPLTATPTQPIAQAQQRRVITTPGGSYAMPTSNGPAREGTRKLQVGRDIVLQGEIGTCDHLIVEGTVKATIKQLQQFDILEHGRYTGSVVTETADINGTFEGDLTVTGRLWLRAGAVVTGTIIYGTLQVEKGATLRGTVDMVKPVAAAAPTTTFSAPDTTTESAATTLPSVANDITDAAAPLRA